MPETIPGLLRLRRSLAPTRTAIIDSSGRHLTYEAWDSMAGFVARDLVESGTLPGDRVALVADNAAIISAAVQYIGIQRAGGIAVLMSSELSIDERVELLEQTGAQMALPNGDVPFVERVRRGAEESEIDLSDPDQHAHILFTSGTTGRPKSVAATHRHHVNAYRTRVVTELGGLEGAGVFAHALPFGTNAGQNMLITCLVEPDITVVLDRFKPAEFAKAVATHSAFGTLLVPAMATMLVAHSSRLGTQLRTLTDIGLTGAAASSKLLERLAALCPDAKITNYYTSTEAWPASVAAIYDASNPGAVGKPVQGTDVAIGTNEGVTRAAGVSGEVLLRSPLLDGRTTLDVGGEHPIAADEWVRTGDRGFLNESGLLFVEDRLERLISTGGFKVMPGEVERRIVEYPQVVDAAVFDVPHEVLGAVVVAAVVWEGGQEETGPLMAALRRRLAVYKVPTRLMSVEVLPLTAAAKTDYERLRRIYQERSSRFVAPNSKLEMEIADLWGHLLERDAPVGREDHFFEIGGHSILALEMLGELNQRYSVGVGLADLLESATVRQLADLIEGSAGAAPAQSERKREFAPLIRMQRWIWAQARVSPAGQRLGGVIGNAHHAGRAASALDPEALAGAFRDVAGRHAMLRSTFATYGKEDEGQLVVEEEPTVEYSCIDLTQMAESDAHHELDYRLREDGRARFNLSTGPIGVFRHYRMPDANDVLSFTADHICCDGWSLGILFDDLAESYARRLSGRPPMEIPADDFPSFAWRLTALGGDKDVEPVLADLRQQARLARLPAPWDDAVDELEADSVEAFEVPERLQEGIGLLSTNIGYSPFAVWLSTYLHAVAWLSGGTSAAVATPLLGRTAAGEVAIFGPCYHPTVIGKSSATFSETLDEVGQRLLRLYRAQLPHSMAEIVGGNSWRRARRIGFVVVPEQTTGPPNFHGMPMGELPPGLRLMDQLVDDSWIGVALSVTVSHGPAGGRLLLRWDHRVLDGGSLVSNMFGNLDGLLKNVLQRR